MEEDYMSEFLDVSYIILHRDHSKNKDRTRNLLEVIKHVRSISSDVEIFVVEQDEKESGVCDLISSFNIKYKFLFNPGLFNRSWGFNYSAKNTHKTKLVFSDNDMLVDKYCFLKGIGCLNTFSIVRPYNGFSNDMTEEQTNEYITTKNINIGTIRNIHNLSGGVIMFDKSSFLKIGMFDERFEGWGGEDDEMMANIYNYQSNGVVTVATLDRQITHLYHSRANINDGKTQPNYQKNVSYITDGKRNDGILILGDENKYV
jgi:hypothetical protein